MRCMATVTDRLYIFCLSLPFILVCAKEMREQQQKSQQHSIVQNTDRQPPFIFEFNQKIPERLRRIRCFYNWNIPIFLIYEYYITKHFKKQAFFNCLPKNNKSISKKQAFFNCFLQNTKSISKIRTFFILVIINNGGCKKLTPLTARYKPQITWQTNYQECISG